MIQCEQVQYLGDLSTGVVAASVTNSRGMATVVRLSGGCDGYNVSPPISWAARASGYRL